MNQLQFDRFMARIDAGEYAKMNQELGLWIEFFASQGSQRLAMAELELFLKEFLRCQEDRDWVALRDLLVSKTQEWGLW